MQKSMMSFVFAVVFLAATLGIAYAWNGGSSSSATGAGCGGNCSGGACPCCLKDCKSCCGDNCAACCGDACAKACAAAKSGTKVSDDKALAEAGVQCKKNGTCCSHGASKPQPSQWRRNSLINTSDC